jgi:hypothetical protein
VKVIEFVSEMVRRGHKVSGNSGENVVIQLNDKVELSLGVGLGHYCSNRDLESRRRVADSELVSLLCSADNAEVAVIRNNNIVDVIGWVSVDGLMALVRENA